MRVLPICMLAVLLVYGVYELRRWSTSPDVVTPRQRTIRSLGFLFLACSLGLWIYGTYLPLPQVHRGAVTPAQREATFRWISYWGLTFLMLLPLVPLALLDARENLKRASEERRRIRIDTLTS